jgi:chromosome segregation ATPase
VDQIRDTLRNLLRSIDDAGKESESLFSKRQSWCDSTIKKFEAANQVSSANLADMQDQLTEHEAEAEEASGTVQQIKVDIEMVQHTIKQTEDMFKEDAFVEAAKGGAADLHLLQSLVDNKKLSLVSLQGQLEVSIPVLSQLQASVAETKQRISYRTDSMAVAKDFVTSLKDGCQAGADRADTQAAARMGESNSIHVALQALDGMEAKHAESNDGQVTPLSFVQTQEVTVDDLTDLFSDHMSSAVAAPVKKVAAPPRSRPKHMHSIASLKPRIAALLAQLKSGGVEASDKATWCSKQREDSALALKSAKDQVAQLTSELNAHIASEAELSEELQRLQDLSATLTATSNSIMEFAKKE